MIILGLVSIASGQNAWINEIHYDNVSTDTNEGVEVIIENVSDYNLSDFLITIYNGSGGASLSTHALNTFSEGSSSSGFTLFYKMISGIQNGAPDGLALSYNATLIAGQFLSYEGVFAATDGVANGITSIDMGVAESGTSTASTQSLQLTGSGTQYSDFTWVADLPQTWGSENDAGDQSLPVELSSWTATSAKGQVVLRWTTESEIENQGFIISRSRNSADSSQELASFATHAALLGHGSTTSRNSYSYTDQDVAVGQTYIYQLSDMDYRGKLTKHAEISITVKATEQDLKPQILTLYPAYPNPFNPETTISFTLRAETLRIEDPVQGGAISLQVFDVNGGLVETLQAGIIEPGTYSIKWAAGKLSSGIYFVRLSSGSNVRIQRVTLLR
ncbi:MAG: T9SS type A sorting domain-containing protein [Candidatus Marinimicrobia bacterium]|nr:T9SS type A sorting domain-containing protein [Candidatus Neomarinimicrobiota bacterium]